MSIALPSYWLRGQRAHARPHDGSHPLEVEDCPNAGSGDRRVSTYGSTISSHVRTMLGLLGLLLLLLPLLLLPLLFRVGARQLADDRPPRRRRLRLPAV